MATRGSMVVRFKTDSNIADDGFKADFVTSGKLSPMLPLTFGVTVVSVAVLL